MELAAPPATGAPDGDGRRARAASAGHAMVAGTSGRLAIEAAASALREGGSAVDAVLVAALAQTALAAGCWVSYAGVLALLAYDARNGAAHSLNAAYNTVLDERDPHSIPGGGTSSGRTALVPGFMAGVQAAHERFGKLPFARLFEPAIEIAEAGFPIGPDFHQLMQYRRLILTRFAEGREVFLSPRGRLRRPGDVLRQPRLADTLRHVAADGADSMYRGDWARRFVDAVSQQGGRLSLRDLDRYEATWSEPLRARCGGYDVFAPALPALGGVHTVEALHLVDCAGLRERGHYAESPEALYWLIHITRAARLGPERPVERRVSPDAASALWKEMERHGGVTYASRLEIQKRLHHSDAVVAVDEQGNVAALCHSINTIAWGSTGLFVDGVSIPDSAWFQQAEIAQAGPGNRLPDAMNPVIATRHHRPALASVCTGAALHETTIQCLLSILDLGMSPRDAAGAPFFMTPLPTRVDALLDGRHRHLMPVRRLLHRLIVSAATALGRPRGVVNPRQAVEANGFSEELLDAVRGMGQELEAIDEGGLEGHWAGIRIDETGDTRLEGAVTTRGPGSDASVYGY